MTLTVDLMHSKQLAHRDINPLNMYITDQGEYKLADFGVAERIVDCEDYRAITGTPIICPWRPLIGSEPRKRERSIRIETICGDLPGLL